ncbi:phosphoglycerate kinase [Candidatus Heimdallarchaeota archaeon]|nr:MAG: phosphoglycerate kinase [Candidatus Gerdarchaeota archaeon]RLI74354.1 MAG: phosphoglycerate kinase [Candidatus Heimdallarchaeota archaeon]
MQLANNQFSTVSLKMKKESTVLSGEIYQKILKENSYEKMKEKKTGLVGVRVDINSPLSVDEIDGKIYKRVVKSPRMDVCAETIVKITKMGYVPVIFAHQGRYTKDGPDANCISLESHADLLNGMLHNINVHFQNDSLQNLSEYDFIGLQPGDAVVLENTRMEMIPNVGSLENNLEEGRKIFNKVFDPIFDYYIIDAFPTSHRANTSLAPVFDTTPILFGPEFIKEFEQIERIRKRLYSSQPIMFGFGGAKFDKLENMKKILSRKNVIAFFGGIPAQLLLRAGGYSLGKLNNEFLENRGVDVAKELLEVLKNGADFYLPIDFTVKIGDAGRTIRTLSIADVAKHDDGMILDIGEHTVNYFINDIILSFLSSSSGMFIKNNNDLKEFEWCFVQAGPFGKVDEYGLNTLPFIARLLKKDLNITILGGDSAAYMRTSGFGDAIEVILSGGAALSYLATGKIKCIDKNPNFRKYFDQATTKKE